MLNPSTYHTEDGEYIFTVQALNGRAKAVLEDEFHTILVMGEVSNFSRPASGHIYFSLKDEHASIRAAWFQGRQTPLAFQFENGSHVIVTADVTLYAEKGEYQLVVRKVQLAGQGLIKQKLEALKRKLAAEGLFAPEHKKALPSFPKTIGVITSQTGAALQDVLAVLRRRAPFIQVRVYACQVQGAAASETIIRALSHAIVERRAEVLLLTRGGGSNEDLWAFNDERLAYAIFNCPLPIVSAVGHEIDLSIADFVADMRAPTPSAAAELLSPNREDLLQLLHDYQQKLQRTMQHIHSEKFKSILFFSRLLVHPGQKIHAQQRLLEQVREKLNKIIHTLLDRQKMKVAFVNSLVEQNNPKHKIIFLRKQLQELINALNQHSEKVLSQKKYRFGMALKKIEILSPISTLERGYAILYTEKNKVLSDVKRVQVGENISAQLTNGKLICKVEKIVY